MFPVNYYLTYSACKYTPSGLVGIISSFAIVPSYCLGMLLKRYSFNLSTVLAIGVSLLGLILLLRKDVSGYSHNSLGLFLAILSDLAVVTALIIVPYLKKKTSVSILAITGQSMLVGGVVSFLIALLQTHSFPFSLEKNYILSLLILSGLTPLVFVSFYYFSNKRGAVFASYVWVVAPIFSVLMSALVKEYRPGLWDGIGIILIIASCLYVNRSLANQSSQESS
jgi:drug/metabolite transporter (DMT)-like permease